MCNGSGRISCPVCEGEGVVGRTIRCPYCSGRKTMVCPLCVEDVYDASWEPQAPPQGSEEKDDPELAGIEDERVRGLYRSMRDHLRHSRETQHREDNAPTEEAQ